MHPNDDDNMVPVDGPDKGEGKVDDGHEMIQHQLDTLKESADALLEHLAQCECSPDQAAAVKKKITLATESLASALDVASGGPDEHETKPEAGSDSPDEHDDGSGFMVTIEKRLSK